MANADMMLDTWVVCKDGSVYCARVILALTFPDMAACFVGREEEDVIRVILPDVTVRRSVRLSRLLLMDRYHLYIIYTRDKLLL